MILWLLDLVAKVTKVILLVTFPESSLRVSEWPMSFSFIQRQEGRTKIINFDGESMIIINFHMPPPKDLIGLKRNLEKYMKSGK